MTEQLSNNGETQPTQEKTITELYQLVEEIQKQLINEIANVRKEIPDENKIKMIVSNTLTGYSTTPEIHKIVGNALAGINRGMSDGFQSVNKKMDEFIEATRQRLASHDSKIDRNTDSIEMIRVVIDDVRQNYATVKANQEQLLIIATRLDNAIRGDGETNGLVGQTASMKLMQDSLAVDQNLMRSELVKLTQLSSENARLHKEALEREKKRQDERDAFVKSLKESAWYVASRGLGAAMTTGAVGTALVAIGQALIGG